MSIQQKTLDWEIMNGQPQKKMFKKNQHVFEDKLDRF